MPLFTFYPYRGDGSSTGFETFECADDPGALVRARQVLSEHSSSARVEVWQGERRVGVVDGAAEPAA